METKPTQGFNVETVRSENHDTFLVWDVSGENQTKWRQFYFGTEGLVFVVDSNAGERFQSSRNMLRTLVQERDLSSVPVLIVNNKNDISGCMSTVEIIRFFDLENVTGRKWNVSTVSSLDNDQSRLVLKHLVKLLDFSS